MTRLVIRNTRWPGDVAVQGGFIAELGIVHPRAGDEVIDAAGGIVTPGLVNTHHHLFQWMTRGRAVGCNLFDWLVALYPVWGRLSAEDVRAAALVGLGELARSGCTTASDHHYLVPGGDVAVFDELVDAARSVGIRLYLSRGSMDLSEKDGGLPPDNVVEDLDGILASTEEVITRYQNDDLVHVVVAPCSPFSVTPELMVESAALARKHGLRLHTHLAETVEEDEHCLARFGRRPLAQLEEWGWTGPDVWFAHGVHFDDGEVQRLGDTGTGIAHCPSSNARLGAGMARVVDLRRVGAPVGLGVDGAASNEVGHLFPEVRQALYLARLRTGRADALMPSEALGLATEGGAEVLGRTDLGRVEVGAAADLAVWPAGDLNDIADPIAALVLGPSRLVDHLLVGGRRVVTHGRLVGIDLDAAHRDLAERSLRLWA